MISVRTPQACAAPVAHSSSSAHWLPGNTFCVDFLSCAHASAVLYRTRSHTSEHLLQRRQYPDRVQIVVIADVRDAKQLALHLSLAIGHDSSEGLTKFLHNRSGIDPSGRFDCSKRG